MDAKAKKKKKPGKSSGVDCPAPKVILLNQWEWSNEELKKSGMSEEEQVACMLQKMGLYQTKDKADSDEPHPTPPHHASKKLSHRMMKPKLRSSRREKDTSSGGAGPLSKSSGVFSRSKLRGKKEKTPVVSPPPLDGCDAPQGSDDEVYGVVPHFPQPSSCGSLVKSDGGKTNPPSSRPRLMRTKELAASWATPSPQQASRAGERRSSTSSSSSSPPETPLDGDHPSVHGGGADADGSDLLASTKEVIVVDLPPVNKPPSAASDPDVPPTHTVFLVPWDEGDGYTVSLVESQAEADEIIQEMEKKRKDRQESSLLEEVSSGKVYSPQLTKLETDEFWEKFDDLLAEPEPVPTRTSSSIASSTNTSSHRSSNANTPLLTSATISGVDAVESIAEMDGAVPARGSDASSSIAFGISAVKQPRDGAKPTGQGEAHNRANGDETVLDAVRRICFDEQNDASTAASHPVEVAPSISPTSAPQPQTSESTPISDDPQEDDGGASSHHGSDGECTHWRLSVMSDIRRPSKPSTIGRPT